MQLTTFYTREELIQTSIFKSLTTAEKEIALACIEQKVRDILPDKFKVLMAGLIGKTYLNTGGDLAKNKDLIDLTIDELCNDLQKYNGLLSFQEIELAFQNGWKKKYGEYYGLNNATYFGWVNAYTWGESRLKAKKAIEDSKKQTVKPELSEEEKKMIKINGALACFEHYKNTGEILDIGNVRYRFLWELGLINHSQEVKDGILKTVKERLLHQEKMKFTEKEFIGQHSGIRHEMEQITAGKSSRLISEGKRESLKIYFKNLIEMGIELKDEIKETNINTNL